MNSLPFSSFRKEPMELVFRELGEIPAPTIFEVGRTRCPDSMEGDGFSTYHFANYIHSHGGRLISVDADPDSVVVCSKIFYLAGLKEMDVTFVNVPPDKFHVPEVDIDLLYLDGPDWEEGNTSAGWHCNCMMFMEKNVKAGGLVLIDDCFTSGVPGGKGALLIPYLLNSGYVVLYEGYQWLLKKPNKEKI